CLLYFIGAWVF
nr:immunoglobulin light chain junction region [Macaca mulatta]